MARITPTCHTFEPRDRVHLTLSPDTVRRARREAERQGLSLSRYTVLALEGRLGRDVWDRQLAEQDAVSR